MSEIDVRAASEDDSAVLVGLLEQLHPRYPGEPRRATELLRDILGMPGRSLLVAEVDDWVVGTIDLLIVPNLSHGGRPWAIVENLVVDEAARGTGVGRALVAYVVHRAKERGCYMLQLLSLAHREDAHTFYRRLGFENVAAGFRSYFDGFAPTRSDD
jgi:GNAT superfamily N-acetyltransferase